MERRIATIIGAVAMGVILLAVLVTVVACSKGLSEGTPQAQGLWYDWHRFQSAVVTDTNGTAMSVAGLATLGIQVEGITTATVTFQGTIDGSTWYSLLATNVTSGVTATSTASDGLFRVTVSGLDRVRCPVSGYSGGTITVVGEGVAH